jgi:hypothetical protein
VVLNRSVTKVAMESNGTVSNVPVERRAAALTQPEPLYPEPSTSSETQTKTTPRVHSNES